MSYAMKCVLFYVAQIGCTVVIGDVAESAMQPYVRGDIAMILALILFCVSYTEGHLKGDGRLSPPRV